MLHVHWHMALHASRKQVNKNICEVFLPHAGCLGMFYGTKTEVHQYTTYVSASTSQGPEVTLSCTIHGMHSLTY